MWGTKSFFWLSVSSSVIVCSQDGTRISGAKVVFTKTSFTPLVNFRQIRFCPRFFCPVPRDFLSTPEDIPVTFQELSRKISSCEKSTFWRFLNPVYHWPNANAFTSARALINFLAVFILQEFHWSAERHWRENRNRSVLWRRLRRG